MAVVTEEFLTVSNWTSSKSGNWSEIVKNPNFERVNQKQSRIRDGNDHLKDPAWHQSQIDELYTDYHKDPAQYRNHSVYECLKAYVNPFEWRPLRLILISSDTDSFLHLNNSVLLQWELIQPDSENYGYPLCGGSPGFLAKCASLASFNSENIGTYIFQGNKINYALYKDRDIGQAKMRRCYLHGSPQILMSMYVCTTSVRHLSILTDDPVQSCHCSI